MNRGDSLERKAEELRASGADGMRLELVKRARNFKRTWVDMAEGLVRVRSRGSYRDWGYEDFHAYCAIELQLKRPTVDKLTGSFNTLEQYAPNVLDRDGIEKPIPEIDSVDYFARALVDPASLPPKQRGVRAAPPPADVVDELKRAVFDEQLPVSALKKRFDPILKPKSEDDARLDQLHRTSAAVRKLIGHLEVSDFVDDDRRRALLADLEALSTELDVVAASTLRGAA